MKGMGEKSESAAIRRLISTVLNRRDHSRYLSYSPCRKTSNVTSANKANGAGPVYDRFAARTPQRTFGAITAMVVLWSMSGAVPAASRSAVAAVDASRIASADREPGQWLTTGRDGGGSYYSPLTKINHDTVKSLGFAWEYRLGTRRGLEATPIVADGVMYAVSNWSIVYALDAATGKQLWRYDPGSDPQRARYEQNDVVSRGIVLWKQKVYVLAPDCQLIALDAATGARSWQVNTLEDSSLPYMCSGAPQLSGAVVVVGNGGGDSSHGGLRGYVSAFDLATGALRWRFYTVPSLADKDPTPEMAAAAKTWDPKRDPQYGGGGNVWHGTAYDANLNLVYIGTGNAAPYSAPRSSAEPATDNLYAASIVALNADTGRMVWYYQTTPGDRWDFDAAATMVLTDLSIHGRKRAVLLQANKNGFFYVLDRKTGQPIVAKQFAYMNWSNGMDSHFRPILSRDADYHSSPKLIYPSFSGAHAWAPMAYSPRTGLVYIPTLDAPNFVVDLHRNPGATLKFVDEATSDTGIIVPDRDFDASYWTPLVGKLPTVSGARSHSGKPLLRASVRAFDPVTGRIAWEQQTSEGYLLLDGGTLATAGDLVFAGREDGQFVAYDAKTGRVLKELDTGTPIMAAPMTYEIGGTQFVAVMAGHGGSFLGTFAGTAAMKYVNEGRLLVFKIGGTQAVPKPNLRVADEPYRQPPPPHNDPNEAVAGFRLFSTYCARCHSLGVPGVTPDLSRLPMGIENLNVLEAIVLKGAAVARGMPRFDDVLSRSDVQAIHAFLLDQSWQFYRAQLKAQGSTH
jgi:quinohemoprotein ethanol dehydrogenase